VFKQYLEDNMKKPPTKESAFGEIKTFSSDYKMQPNENTPQKQENIDLSMRKKVLSIVQEEDQSPSNQAKIPHKYKTYLDLIALFCRESEDSKSEDPNR
jgi:hypothetical protein